ncbi:hypothetical protein LGT39_05955 [Demequina sp. TTPB684]|uniref:hypothetical protein n=1 Tax=unclassified Demequina TaxID=2620311 RepID=UPI001CF2B063|nr:MULTISPECIES: hypothetical protein [unclassified Demequina]MCB2412392.1 hypothetical protein [Demequina sp. TTPB684]UPU89524.1 hypothetical protein LGT36_006240 [Demequina sp. TMPB413]
MIKAGYSRSWINDVIYMGDVVNRAAHLAHEAGRNWTPPSFVDGVSGQNLKDDNTRLLTQRNATGLDAVYQGDVARTDMNDWVEALT